MTHTPATVDAHRTIAAGERPTRDDIAAALFRHRYPYAVETIAHRHRGVAIKVGHALPITDEAALDTRKGPL